MANGLNTKQHAFVSAYLGSARFNATEAARIAGYAEPNTQGPRLLVNVGIQAIIETWRAEVKLSAITDMSYRISRLHEIESKLWQVIDERSEDSDMLTAPGGKTGLLAHDVKSVGAGPMAYTVDVFNVDTAVTKEIRSVYDDVAKELGQRVDKINLSGSLRREYVLVGTDDPTTEIEP